MRLEDISSSFSWNTSRFSISNVSLDEIVEKVGAPVFIYDTATIAHKYQYLRSKLPDSVTIHYAMKANPSLAVVHFIHALGAGVEIASNGELYACKKIGIPPEKIVFAGPSKTNQDISEALQYGIFSLHVESVSEARRVSAIAEKLNLTATISIRINPVFSINNAVCIMGGGPQKFGIDEEILEPAIHEILSLPNIKLQGIHIFSATGIMSQEGFLQNLASCFSIASRCNSFFPVCEIDIGGGLGIPYAEGEQELNIDSISDHINDLFAHYSFIEDQKTRIIIEPGRFLVGQSGIYVCKVIEKKKSRNTSYLLVDGGIQHVLRPALIKQNHPTFNLSRTGSSDTFDVGGSLCTSIDFLAKSVPLPRDSQAGDLIGIFCCGAYGFTESMPWFLSHDIPAEVVIHEGSVHIVRPRVPIESFIDQQIVIT